MHELSIALSIVDGVLEEAKRHEPAQVTAIHLQLGRLSGIEKDALLFSYSIAAQDTPLADARLMIEDIDVIIHCSRCGVDGPAKDFPILQCAECGSTTGQVISGDELEIVSLELAA